MTSQELIESLRGRLDSQLWRLSHLYWIENKQGVMQRFSPNAAQLRLHRGLGSRNAILKARQLGISTYVALLMLDRCIFSPNYHAGIIDKSLLDAEQKLDKIRFAWENLDYMPSHASEQDQALALLGRIIKQQSGTMRGGKLSPCTDSRSKIALSNGSDIRIGTTLRGGTLQMLHISELAHVSIHSPWRAREIRSGAINTVASSGSIILESTHEGGHYGVNYDIMNQAMENRATPAAELSELDFRFFFISWFDHSDYQLSGRGGWTERMGEYFEKLADVGIELSHAQKLWYARMERSMGSAMQQEYPSSPHEAFSTGHDGAIYGHQLSKLREDGHIGAAFDYNAEEALYSSWDLGLSDHTAIWLVQCYGGHVYWLDHYAINQQPISHFASKIKAWEQQYGLIEEHYLPHDAAHRDPHGHSYVESLAKLGIQRVRVVPRSPDIWRGINNLRSILCKSYFHPNTLKGRLNLKGLEEPSALHSLEMYRSAPPSSSGSLRESPLHDEHSHSADAARYFAEAHSHGMIGSAISGRIRRRALM